MEERSYGFVPLRRSSQGFDFLVVEAAGRGFRAFPKGHWEPGETPLQTATRELLEETGCVPIEYWTGQGWSGCAEEARLVSTIQYCYTKRSGETGEKEVSLFLALVEQRGEVLDRKEIAGVEWHPFHPSSASVFSVPVKRSEFQQQILPLLSQLT